MIRKTANLLVLLIEFSEKSEKRCCGI